MSPDLDQHPDPLSMVKAMCAAARQPDRGRFRHPEVLERAVGKRQYRAMVERGDVVPANPGVYLDGWDEWQEGDHTVAERMKRMRDRRKRRGNARVTPPPSPARIDVTTDAGTTTEEGLQGVGVGVGVSPPPPVGRRKDGTNPRSLGTNPRANGTSTRQERQRQKTGPTALHEILRKAAAAGSEA